MTNHFLRFWKSLPEKYRSIRNITPYIRPKAQLGNHFYHKAFFYRKPEVGLAILRTFFRFTINVAS